MCCRLASASAHMTDDDTPTRWGLQRRNKAWARGQITSGTQHALSGSAGCRIQGGDGGDSGLGMLSVTNCTHVQCSETVRT